MVLTVFIFSSDNGGCTTSIAAGCDGGSSNWPLRGEKGTLYEGGIRAVSFIYSPRIDVLPIETRGTISHSIVHAIDWLPSLIYLAGGTTSTVDGKVIWDDILARKKHKANNQKDRVTQKYQSSRFIVLNHDPFLEGSALLMWPWKLLVVPNYVNGGWSFKPT